MILASIRSLKTFGGVSSSSVVRTTRSLSASESNLTANSLNDETPTILFSSWRSSCSYRVRACLNLKKIPHEIKPVDLRALAIAGSENSEDYKVNPMRYLPALIIDGHTLIESMAIMEYLDETRPEVPLLPRDPLKRAQVRTICEIIVSGVQPLQNIGVLNHIGDYMGEKERAWSQHWITRGFKAIEKLLASSAGQYCVGDEVTLADCCLLPQVYNARRFHIDLGAFPIIVRIDRLCHNHPAFRQAHPLMQIDFPAEILTDPSFFLAKL